MADIKYVQYKNIDQVLWDKAIDQSVNGLVYPYSFFLNSMSDKQWDALVMGEYEAVFPLVWKSKFGLKYLYQPFFCQQLGLFSKEEVSSELLNRFIEAIPLHFRYWNFHLNYSNKYSHSDIQFVQRTSYTIDLNTSYEELHKAYNSDAKKNISRAKAEGYTYKKEIDIFVVADCFFTAYGQHYARTEQLKKTISNCAVEAIQLGKGFTRAVYGSDGKLWAAGFFFHAHGRIHYAMAAPTEAGKKFGATHTLIDGVLKEFAGSNTIFDFEGSDIQSVAYFYAKFGSIPKQYLQLLRNRLPWWCKFMKREGGLLSIIKK